MNDPIEREVENMGGMAASAEPHVFTDTIVTAPDGSEVEDAAGSHTGHVEMKESETTGSVMDTSDVVTEDSTMVAADAPTQEPVEAMSTSDSDSDMGTQAEASIYDDPIFGPIKRLMAEILGDA